MGDGNDFDDDDNDDVEGVCLVYIYALRSHAVYTYIRAYMDITS